MYNGEKARKPVPSRLIPNEGCFAAFGERLAELESTLLHSAQVEIRLARMQQVVGAHYVVGKACTKVRDTDGRKPLVFKTFAKLRAYCKVAIKRVVIDEVHYFAKKECEALGVPETMLREFDEQLEGQFDDYSSRGHRLSLGAIDRAAQLAPALHEPFSDPTATPLDHLIQKEESESDEVSAEARLLAEIFDEFGLDGQERLIKYCVYANREGIREIEEGKEAGLLRISPARMAKLTCIPVDTVQKDKLKLQKIAKRYTSFRRALARFLDDK